MTCDCERPKVLLSARDAAELLGQKSRGGVYRKMASGELPFVLIDGQRMLERDGLEARWSAITRRRIDSPGSRSPAHTSPTGTPDYNEERAWHERERRLLAQLERRQRASELVYRADVEQAQAAVALTLRRELEVLPKEIRKELPHLSAEDEQVIEQLLAVVLTAVEAWRLGP